MPTLTLTTKYQKNTGLVISPEELMSLYFYGLKIESTDGTKLDPKTVEMYIRSAQGEIEKFFDIILNPVLITEQQDYFRDDYENGFPFVRTSFPIRKIKSLTGRLNGIDQIKYPFEWLQMRTSSKNRYYRQFGVVANGSMVTADSQVIMLGISAYYGLRSYPQIFNYWNVQYEGGFEIGQIPSEIIQLIGMLASIPLLCIAGSLVLSSPGISAISLGIDGLNQSVTSSPNAYGLRIKEYKDTIKEMSLRLKNSYKGLGFVSL